MNNNNFGGKRLYIDTVDNAFAAAHKQYWVRITTHMNEVDGVMYPHTDSTKTVTDDDYWVDSPVVTTIMAVNYPFNGNYQDRLTCPQGEYMKIHIQFEPFSNEWKPSTGTSFSGYPYGYYYLSFYNTNKLDKLSQVRIYNKHSTSTGWNVFTATKYIDRETPGEQGTIEKIIVNECYSRSCVDFLIYGKESGNVELSEISWFRNRGVISSGSVLTKYSKNSVFYDLEWYKHNTNSANERTAYVEAETGMMVSKGFKDTTMDASKFVKTDSNGKMITGDIAASEVVGLDATLYESVTYSQLVTKIDNSQLVKGKMYRITDYNTVVKLTNVSSAGHAFDLVVTAISTNKLSHRASALLHDGDTYFSNGGAYLEKWQVWYDVDNNRDKYAWVNTTTGKGVIYRLIDEYGNDCPYDFKNILFTKENVYTNVYTFNKFAEGDTDNSDLSLSSPYCYNNIIGPKITVRKATLNNIVFLNTSNSSYCFNNTFGNDCANNTFGNACYGNTFGVTFNDNVTGSGFVYNSVGNYCANNVFQTNFRYGTLGNSCSNNNFYSNMNSVIVENFNRYIELRGVGGSTLQNVYIAQGCSGTSETHTNVSIPRDLSYRTTVSRDSNGNIRIYNEEDPVLPTVTSEDNGKILMVSNGEWTAQTVPVSDNVLY
jgi:hypothetical protein